MARKCVERFPADRCGFVVGATHPAEAGRLRAVAPDRLFLVPGIGAQGGDLRATLAAASDADGGGVLLTASRSVLYASDGRDFEAAAEAAARELKDAANAARLSKLLKEEKFPVQQLTVVTNDQETVLPRLIETLTAHHAVMQKIAPEEVTLEDVFIARTGRTLAEDTQVK